MVFQLRDRLPREPAWIHAGKRTQVHIDIERYTMVTTAAADSQTKCGNFCIPYVYAMGIGSGKCRNLVATQKINYSLLYVVYKLPDTKGLPAKVYQQIDNGLPRCMVGDLSTPVRAHDRHTHS